MAARRRPKRWVVVMFGSVALFFGAVAFVGCYSGIGPYDLPPKSRALEETLAVSKSLGLPMTQAELVGDVPPDDENAAIEVLATIERIDFSNSAALTGRTGTDKVAQDTRDAWLRANSERLDEIKTAVAKKPGWHVGRDYDLGPSLLFPDFSKIKNVARGLFTRSVIAADRGDIEAALSDFRTIRDIARRLSSEPSLIALLVAIATDTIALRSVVYLADAFEGNASALARLEEAITETSHRLDAFAGIRGEFYLQLHISRNLRDYGGLGGIAESMTGESSKPIDPGKIKRDGVPSGLMARASMTSFADTWNQVLKRHLRDGAVERGWGADMASRCKTMESRMRVSEILAMIIMPVYEQTDNALINDDVMQDIAVAFVRAMRHRAATGSWPKNLAAIDAEFDDPFSPGRPIQMSASGGEMRVWSVGRDRVDNAGSAPTATNKEGDTVFKWPPKLAKGS